MEGISMVFEPVRQRKAAQVEVNHEISTILDLLCQEIELPTSRIADAKARYGTVTNVFAREGSRLAPYSPRLFTQGSHEIGTANRPLRTHVFDVDLACFCTATPPWTGDQLRDAVFQELESDGRYKGKVKKLRRCVQLTYADEFHIDIMPCVPWTHGEGMRLPESKNKSGWGLTHPEGFSKWFKGCATHLPLRTKKALMANSMDEAQMQTFSRAQVDPFPEWNGLRKQPLQRCVQLFKRHRDKDFYEDNSRAPASVILTTLAAQSYMRCVSEETFETPLDLLRSVAQRMIEFVNRTVVNGQIQYTVANPVLPSENFAERWNADAAFPIQFYRWHTKLCGDLAALEGCAGQGLAKLGMTLDTNFGSGAGSAAVRKFSESTRGWVQGGALGIITGATPSISRATPTTFHGG